MGLEEIYDLIIEGLEMPISYFLNSEKRIYFLYLISSAILAYYIYYKSKPKSSFLKYIFNKNVWLSKSAFIDYLLVFFNGLVKVLLIGPYLIYGLYIAHHTNEFLLDHFGYPNFSLGEVQTLILYTITITIAGDFASYFTHFLMHKIPFLWEFHKVHHSATSLNPITQYRIHPIELLINNVRGILIFGLFIGFFDYLSNHSVHPIMFIGVNVFSFAFMFFGANLRHSHVRLKYPNFLEYFLISPFQHQIHHSNKPQHFNKNMGSKLAIWDYLFGTLIRSKNISKIEFGLGEENLKFNSFWKNLYTPFKNILLSIKSIFIGK